MKVKNQEDYNDKLFYCCFCVSDFFLSNFKFTLKIFCSATVVKIRKKAKIRNRYNQARHLTQDTNGKVTTSQLDITNESQEVSPFPGGDKSTLVTIFTWSNIML